MAGRFSSDIKIRTGVPGVKRADDRAEYPQFGDQTRRGMFSRGLLLTKQALARYGLALNRKARVDSNTYRVKKIEKRGDRFLVALNKVQPA